MNSNELLISVIEKLIQIEKDKMNMTNLSMELIHLINGEIYENGSVNTIKDVTGLLKILTLPLNEWEIDFSLLSENIKEKSLVSYNGTIRREFIEYYNEKQSIENYHQKNMLAFLVACRNKNILHSNLDYQKIYTEGRKFINGNNVYLNPVIFEDFLEDIIIDQELVEIYRSFYSESKSFLNDFYVCPICGERIAFDFEKERKCKNRICQRLNMDEPPIKKNKGKYVVMKSGIKVYTLLPGITELKVFNKLKNRFKLNIELYPKIDLYDISVSNGNKQLNLDIKDHKDPKKLVDMIVEKQGIDKFIDNDVILVIPDYRKDFQRDYIDIIKKKFHKKNIFIKVLYERQLYKYVEVYFGGDKNDKD
ncbi:MAG: hypothetical protein N4A64_08480 [Marinisporobacter sp.]|jgi:hypothetical protein|nr:hypothetical protein [Marinisporobacter sp.]